MFLLGVTIPATVPQRSEILEGLMNYPVNDRQATVSGWLTYQFVFKNKTKIVVLSVLTGIAF
jgi:hypothetical protein